MTFIRGGGEASATVSRGSSRSRRAATPLPAFFPELVPSYEATLGYTAEKTIRADIAWTQANIGHVETGGWLFASSHNPNFILLATVPGADSAASRESIHLGYEQMEAVQRLHSDLELVGDWHLHPSGGDVPSDADLRSSVHGAKLARGCWYSLIATPSTT